MTTPPINSHLLKLSKKRSRQGLYEFLGENYQKIPEGALVLSVGSGGEINNLLDEHSKRHNFKVISIDIDPKRFPDIVGDICTYDIGESLFDVVIMGEVLEHLHSPQSGLDNVHRSLKPKGRLLLTVPFILPIHDAPYDYFRFTRHGLEMLLKKFSSFEIKERNSYFEAIDVLWVRLLLDPSRNSKYLSYLMIPLVYYFFRPISLLLSKIIPTTTMTTGYVVCAEK
jgi:SAM-dependent methyltransferase